ncbi:MULTISPECIES: DUF2567 domain-containing protein [Nocardiaceae]|uniref:DUF2567 domain-containing protein n=1 Tax=Rhodococcoides kroppenstedtii TaxID=293050 RepID=A0ABS7NZN4_9NOCA|nr:MULTISPECIES: DUF2567 domain-containing protein [Rhodococcus]AMY19309.1 hypothetical protein A3Q40_01929 [Rhodococcus sp. PBTS 1]MBY6314535.1 DUF2567 domain-containing protein [Rhodococcus kroppenstedtii]MBY6322342.1 DUF2567 domain-containing protein [Rhodococcus kroppenstedtii]MBY6401163.1 DUF2567 domain-containing protein [Rhodococcus kroppenstedtii]MBY6435285.1 DUF2567 domain-containing protein [Rhodococcus kroppenstedtii]
MVETGVRTSVPGWTQWTHSTQWARWTVVAAVVGALLGVGWALLVPPRHVGVLGDGRAAVLTGESLHRFDAVALFALVTAAAGVVGAAAMWRAGQGTPRRALGIVASAAVGSVSAAGVGLGLAAWRYPDAADAAAGTVVALAPDLATPMAVLPGPLAAAVTLVVLVAFAPDDTDDDTDTAGADGPEGDDDGPGKDDGPVSPAA